MIRKNLEDLYPLSPMQQGILFHSLLAPGSGVYICLLVCALEGKLNVPAFKRAWEWVVERYTILRTAFIWEGLDEALQVVYRQVDLELEQSDWRCLELEDQRARFEQFLRAEQLRDFALDEAPLTRLKLIRLADQRYQFIWTYHHIALDGWSQQLVVKEVLSAYEALCRGQAPEGRLPRSYRDYIIWLRKQDTSQAVAFWTEALDGFSAPTTIMNEKEASDSTGETEDYGDKLIRLSRDLTASLLTEARNQRVTLNTFLQGAWAFLLSRRSGQNDVVFGTVVSGRPADLEGADLIVGPFINTLPMRVKIDFDLSVADWLRGIQRQHVELRQFEYSPLVQAQELSQIRRGVPLFKSILAFENYPLDNSVEKSPAHIQVTDVRSILKNSYPLAVVSGYGDELPLQVIYDCRYFAGAEITKMLSQLEQALSFMGARPCDKLVRMKEDLDQHDRRRQSAKEEEFGVARRRMLDSIRQRYTR